MENVSVRLDPETVDELETEADDRGMSRAAYLREIIESRHESERLQSELDRIRDEYETKIERLQNEKRLILEEREEKRELVEYVQEEKSLARERAEREKAPVWTRAKYWVFGAD